MPLQRPIRKHLPLSVEISPSCPRPAGAPRHPAVRNHLRLPADLRPEAPLLLPLHRHPTGLTLEGSPTGRPTWTEPRSFRRGTTPCTRNKTLVAPRDAAMHRHLLPLRLHPLSRAADHHHQPETHLDAEQLRRRLLWALATEAVMHPLPRPRTAATARPSPSP